MKKALALFLALIAAAALGVLARTFLFSSVRIAGTSMSDTLVSGDIALVLRIPSDIRRGDVVECTFSGRESRYIKRVIGLPGDRVEFSDGALLLNGRPLSEPYVSSPTEDMSVELGGDEFFLLGDNRAESYDSRAEDMGCIPRDRILGHVKWILWPAGRFGPVE